HEPGPQPPGTPVGLLAVGELARAQRYNRGVLGFVIAASVIERLHASLVHRATGDANTTARHRADRFAPRWHLRRVFRDGPRLEVCWLGSGGGNAIHQGEVARSLSIRGVVFHEVPGLAVVYAIGRYEQVHGRVV